MKIKVEKESNNCYYPLIKNKGENFTADRQISKELGFNYLEEYINFVKNQNYNSFCRNMYGFHLRDKAECEDLVRKLKDLVIEPIKPKKRLEYSLVRRVLDNNSYFIKMKYYKNNYKKNTTFPMTIAKECGFENVEKLFKFVREAFSDRKEIADSIVNIDYTTGISFEDKYDCMFLLDKLDKKLREANNMIKKDDKVVLKNDNNVINSGNLNEVSFEENTEFTVVSTCMKLPGKFGPNDTIVKRKGCYYFAPEAALELYNHKEINSLEELQEFCDKHNISYTYKDGKYHLDDNEYKLEINI